MQHFFRKGLFLSEGLILSLVFFSRVFYFNSQTKAHSDLRWTSENVFFLFFWFLSLERGIWSLKLTDFGQFSMEKVL